MSLLYDIIFLLFILIYLPYFLLKGKYHRDLWQRFGIFSKSINYKLSTINSPLWLHAVSVGEVAAIKPLWERLRREFPSRGFVISTITRTGNELARRFASNKEAVLYLPFDLSFIINGVLKRLKPQVLIIAETEIWPNLINACRRSNIPVILVNGRISNKAFKRYKLARFISRALLKKVNFICAQTAEDKKRFVYLGAPFENIRVSGNMKYDNKDAIASPDAVWTKQSHTDLRMSLGLTGREKIFAAGSTHKGEEEIILGVFKKLTQDFKDLYLIIAPRHIERAGEVKRLAGNLPVTVIDKIGVLRDVYSISDIVFVGGSLLPYGGHNIIEPAVFAKPILFGPHMFNFHDIACEFLKGDAAIMVKDREDLEMNCNALLNNEKERTRLGCNARMIVLKNQGAVEGCIYEIKRILGDV